MRKTILFYLVAFLVLLFSFLFFNRAYKEMIRYAELANRGNIVYSRFQNLSMYINNAAVTTPDLTRITSSSTGVKLFFADSQSVIQQLDSLKSSVKDSINIQIAEELDINIRSELSWLLKSNVPDSIINHKSAKHIASLQHIDSLIGQGIKRTIFLIDYRNTKLNGAFNNMRAGMIFFILLSGILLFYTANVFRQKSKNEKQFRALVESSDDIIAMLDENMYPFYRSSSAERLTGFTSGDRKKGVKIEEVHSDDKEKINTCLLDMKAHPGKAIPVTYRIKHKKGHYIWLEGTFTNLFHDPNVGAIVVNMRDITGRKKAEEEVIKVYKEKESVLNRISDGVVSIDNDWRYTFLNDAAMATHPFSKEATLGKVIWEVHPEMKGTVFWDKYHEAMRTRKVVEIESHYAPMNIWFSVKVYPSSDGLTIFYKDVTESKKAEEKLKNSNELFSNLFNHNPSSLAISDINNGKIINVNESYLSLFKFSGKEEVIGKTSAELGVMTHPNQRNEIARLLKEKKIVQNYETDVITRQGDKIWLSISLILMEVDNTPCMFSISIDITARKKAEEQLRQRAKEISDYKEALDESAIVAITDQKGIIKHVNDNFCRISKYSKEELIGKDHRIINSAYHSKEFIKKLWSTIAKGKIWKGEIKNKAKDGTIYWVDTTIVPFLNEEGNPYQYIAIRSDVTERKKAEEALNNLNEGLEQKVIERTVELEYSNKELEAFSYSVSHDLRAPIRAISGYAKILEEDYAGKFDSDGIRILYSIMHNSKRMGELIDDLLAFSRLGRKQVAVSEINMIALVKSVKEELLIGYSENKIEFNVNAIPPAKGDQSLIKQVWVNLISNALKYSKDKPKTNIEISAYEKDNLVVYCIKDNGVGFDMQYYDKLFGVFQRLHSQQEFDGTGIGLAIVQKIVQRHNGTVWAESKLNEGTCFYFSLPTINS